MVTTLSNLQEGFSLVSPKLHRYLKTPTVSWLDWTFCSQYQSRGKSSKTLYWNILFMGVPGTTCTWNDWTNMSSTFCQSQLVLELYLQDMIRHAASYKLARLLIYVCFIILISLSMILIGFESWRAIQRSTGEYQCLHDLLHDELHPGVPVYHPIS